MDQGTEMIPAAWPLLCCRLSVRTSGHGFISMALSGDISVFQRSGELGISAGGCCRKLQELDTPLQLPGEG